MGWCRLHRAAAGEVQLVVDRRGACHKGCCRTQWVDTERGNLPGQQRHCCTGWDGPGAIEGTDRHRASPMPARPLDTASMAAGCQSGQDDSQGSRQKKLARARRFPQEGWGVQTGRMETFQKGTQELVNGSWA